MDDARSRTDALPGPLRCDLTAIAPAERAAHREVIRRLVAETVGAVVELPDGLALAFRADAYETVVRFVAGERLCCPFLAFALEIAPERGALRLGLTGPVGTKQFLRAELGLPAASG